MIYAAVLGGAWKMRPTSYWVPVLLHLSWLLLLYILPMDHRSSCWPLPGSTGALLGAPARSLFLYSDTFRNPNLKEGISFCLLLKVIFNCPLWGQAVHSAPEAECFLSQNSWDCCMVPIRVRSGPAFRTEGRVP